MMFRYTGEPSPFSATSIHVGEVGRFREWAPPQPRLALAKWLCRLLSLPHPERGLREVDLLLASRLEI